MTKGRMIYVPPVVLLEIEDIRKRDKVNTNSEAFNKFTNYARIGRAVQKIINLDFSNATLLPAIPRSKDLKKNRGFF